MKKIEYYQNIYNKINSDKAGLLNSIPNQKLNADCSRFILKSQASKLPNILNRNAEVVIKFKTEITI